MTTWRNPGDLDHDANAEPLAGSLVVAMLVAIQHQGYGFSLNMDMD